MTTDITQLLNGKVIQKTVTSNTDALKTVTVLQRMPVL